MHKLVASIKYRPINILSILSVASLYLVNNKFIKPNTKGLIHVFFVSYFNDLLCPCLFLAYTNLLLITCGREVIYLKTLLLLSLVAGCVWEFASPYLKSGAVTDPIDFLCYIFGAIAYWSLLKSRIKLDGGKNDRS